MTANRLAPPIATAVLFAGSFLAAARAIEELDPMTATLARYVVALALLAVLARARSAGAPAIPRRAHGRLALLGATGIVGYHGFFFAALAHTTPTATAVVNATSPIVTGALAAVWARERLGRRAWIGIGLSVAGVVWLLTGGRPAALLESLPRRGELLMLGAVLSWAVYAVAAQPLFAVHGSLAVTLRATAWGVALSAPPALFLGAGRELTAMTPGGLLAVLYMGVAASGLGYLLYGRSVGVLGPTRTSALVYGAVPLLVAGLAFLVRDETPARELVVAAALVIGGLTLTLREEPRADE